MSRPFDTRYRRSDTTSNENATENEVASLLERSLKNSGLNIKNNNNSNKPQQLLRAKSVNQVLNQQRLNALADKGKQSNETVKKPIVKKEQTKTSVPLKRPVSEGTLPIPKRTEIEHCNPHEEEFPYVPDDIEPLDFDCFDTTINLNAYETTGEQLADYDAPLQELESFRTTKRQFQQNDPSIDNATLSPTFTTVDDKDDSLPQDSSFTIQEPLNDEPSTNFPSEIEFCPSHEEELAYVPEIDQSDLKLDLSVFSPGINISAYDLSKYFDEQVEFPSDLFDDEDLIVNAGLAETTFDDLAIFFDNATAYDSIFRDDAIDYDDIPFSNHRIEEIPIIN